MAAPHSVERSGDHQLRDARELTDRIKTTAEDLWSLMVRAYSGRAWELLGYATWSAYCEAEFGSSRIRLPSDERPGVVHLLSNAGMSVREIAAATGSSRSTVGRELNPPGVPNGTHDGDEEDRREVCAWAAEIMAELRQRTQDDINAGYLKMSALRRDCVMRLVVDKLFLAMLLRVTDQAVLDAIVRANRSGLLPIRKLLPHSSRSRSLPATTARSSRRPDIKSPC